MIFYRTFILKIAYIWKFLIPPVQKNNGSSFTLFQIYFLPVFLQVFRFKKFNQFFKQFMFNEQNSQGTL